MLVVFMQIFSISIVAAGAYLCLVHAGVLPAPHAIGGVAIAASCVLFGAALGVLALTLSVRSAPVEAAEHAAVASEIIAYPPPAASAHGDGSFEAYEYH
jgi:hypothetical protein